MSYALRQWLDASPEVMAGIEEQLAGSVKTSSFTSILLDNSTVDYALDFLDGEQFGTSLLPSRSDVAMLAVSELVNAIVLHERILIGPSPTSLHSHYRRSDLLAVRELVEIEQTLSPEHLFAILSLARSRAIAILNEDRPIITVLEAAVGRPLRLGCIKRSLENMTPYKASTSPDARYIRREQDQLHYMNNTILGPSSVAMGAIDPSNKGRPSQDLLPKGYFKDYQPSYLAKLDKVPSKTLPEFYAAHLLYRIILYFYLADFVGCTYRVDGLRASLAKEVLQPARSASSTFAEVILRHVGKEEQRRDDVVNDILGYEAFKVSVPLVLRSVLKRSAKPEDVLGTALELRESRRVRQFRSYCLSVDEAVSSGDRKAIERTIAQLSRYGLRLAESLEGNDQLPVMAVQELVKYGSPLLAAMLPILETPLRSIHKKIRLRKLAFVDDLRGMPRSMSLLEYDFARLWNQQG